MSKNQNHDIKVFGYPKRWYLLIQAISIIIVWIIMGIQVLFFIVPFILIGYIVGYPFLKLVEVSPKQIVIRRMYRRLGRVYTINMSDIKSATTTLPPTLRTIFSNSRRVGPQYHILTLQMKDNSRLELHISRFIVCSELEKELSKYVEIFGTPRFLDI